MSTTEKSLAIRVKVHATTHVGKVRDGNEDVIGIGCWVSAAGAATDPVPFISTELTSPIACVITDGMGGHPCGDIASTYVAERLLKLVDADTSVDSLFREVNRINEGLYIEMLTRPQCRGMGATAAALIVGRYGEVTIINVGDTRIYHVDQKMVTLLSVDDTLSIASADGRLAKRGVTECFGASRSKRPLKPHVRRVSEIKPARFLLCSDGLTDLVDDDQISSLQAFDGGVFVRRLLDAALNAGGMDNVSIMIVDIEIGSDKV